MHRLPKVLTALSAALFLGLAGCNPPKLSDTETHCGNGVIDPGETCDDGNTVSGDGCSSACWSTYKATCGDGKKEQKEQCDDGDTDDSNACKNDCTPNAEAAGVCGDGAVTGAELCDDSNTTGGDGCPATCGYVASATECVGSSATDTRAACPVRIQTLKASIEGGSSTFQAKKVSVPNALVIGKDANNNGFWIYTDPAPGSTSEGYAGIYVFVNNGGASTRTVGERIDIRQADVNYRFGQLQLATGNGVSLSVVSKSQGNELPAYVTVTPADIRTGGPRAAELNGQLVQVNNVVITSGNPDATDRDEFVVDSTTSDPTIAGVRVDDQGYDYPNTIRNVGAPFGMLRGVLAYTFDNSKILPLKAGDLQPPVPNLSIAPATGAFVRVGGGTTTFPTALTVTLGAAYNEALTVTLTSSEPAKATVPATISIPAGQTTATVPVTGVAAADAVTISATLPGKTAQTATVRVLGADEQALVASVTPNPVTAIPGSAVTMTVTLDRPAPANTSVALTVDPAGLGTVAPTALPVALNATTATFTFTAPAQATVATGTVTATLGGSSQSATVNVSLNPPVLAELTPATTTVAGGATQQFTVRLDKAAPADVAVTLAATGGVGTVPATATVTTGNTTATFDLTATDVASQTVGTVTATLGSTTLTSNVTVTYAPPFVQSVAVAPLRVKAGGTATATLTLNKAAPAGGTTVDLSVVTAAADTVLAGITMPATVTIAEGQTGTTATVTVAAELTGYAKGRVRAQATSTTAAYAPVLGLPRIVISELAGGNYTTTSQSDDEFIELYNPTSVDVNVSGFRIQYKSATNTAWNSNVALASLNVPMPANTVIKAHSFLLIGKVPAGTSGGYVSTDPSNTLDVTYGAEIGMGGQNSSGTVRLIDPEYTGTDRADDANTIDRLGWWGAGANIPNDAEGGATAYFNTGVTATTGNVASIERKANAASDAASMSTGADATKGNSHDTNVNSADFVLRPTRQPQNSSVTAEVP